MVNREQTLQNIQTMSVPGLAQWVVDLQTTIEQQNAEIAKLESKIEELEEYTARKLEY